MTSKKEHQLHGNRLSDHCVTELCNSLKLGRGRGSQSRVLSLMTVTILSCCMFFCCLFFFDFFLSFFFCSLSLSLSWTDQNLSVRLAA